MEPIFFWQEHDKGDLLPGGEGDLLPEDEGDLLPEDSDLEYLTEPFEMSPLPPLPETEDKAEEGLQWSWKGVTRATLLLLDAGWSIYDAIQLSRQEAGYLPKEEYLVKQIQAKYPHMSESEIRGAMLKAKTSPRYMEAPGWLERQTGKKKIPTWVWIVVPAGILFAVLMKR